MTDKYQALRGSLARINSEDTDDCFEAYLLWKQIFDADACKALLAERDALRDALQAVVDAAGPGSGPEIGKAEAALAKATGQ